MENEQLQHLIVAIEGLIELTGANGRIAESRVMQELERAKISDTQTEAILALLQQIKQKCSDEDSRKEFHTENLQAFQDLADNLKEELKEGNTNIASAFEKMTTQLEAAINSLKEKDTPLESVEIKNLADIKFPEVQKVEIVKMPEEKKEPAEPVEVKEPKWYQAFNYDKILLGIKKIFESLTLKVSFDKTPGINILDEKGKIISDFSPIIRNSLGGGGVETVGLKNKNEVRLNPATEEKQQEIISSQELANSTLDVLRRIAKILEPISTQDIAQRQRVAVEGISGTTLGNSVTGLSSGAGIPASNFPTAGAPIPSPGTSYWQNVWVGPVDQRYQIMENARMVYATAIRDNITF